MSRDSLPNLIPGKALYFAHKKKYENTPCVQIYDTINTQLSSALFDHLCSALERWQLNVN